MTSTSPTCSFKTISNPNLQHVPSKPFQTLIFIPISNSSRPNPQAVEAKDASLDTCSSLSGEMKNSTPSSRRPLLMVVPFMAGGEEDLKGLTFSYFLLLFLKSLRAENNNCSCGV